MPSCFYFNGYNFYFWSNEYYGDKLEPVHVHFTNGTPSKNDPKIWLMQDGTASIDASDAGMVKPGTAQTFIKIVEANKGIIEEKWLNHFGEIEFKRF